MRDINFLVAGTNLVWFDLVIYLTICVVGYATKF